MIALPQCTRCGRETTRAGHPFDGLCRACDYCTRYAHAGDPCARCGYPDYTARGPRGAA